MAQIRKYDLVINGGGVAGTTLALACANADFSVALIAPNESLSALSDEIDLRVRALNQTSENIFQQLGIWSALPETRLGHFDAVKVWHGQGKLHYHAQANKKIGTIVEEKVLLHALHQRMTNHPHIHIFHTKARALKPFIDSIYLTLENKEVLQASLLVGADGAHSWVRKHAGIDLKTRPYGQNAMVATVKTAAPHGRCARQRFLATGPLVFLPLAAPRTSSIVWSLPSEKADALQADNDENFKQALNTAFEHTLGEITQISARACFPLFERRANTFIQANIALVSDAAHTMHPLAGLGLNLGLMDIAWLYDVLCQAKKRGEPIGHETTLARYQRARLFPVKKWQLLMQGFHHLMRHENDTLAWLCDHGMNGIDQQTFLKRYFMAEASQLEHGLPSLAMRPV